MKIPLVVWIAVWCQLLPLAAALARPRWLRGPRVGVALWLVLLLLNDATSWTWSHWLLLGNNHVVSYVFMPIQGVVVLWAIAQWQVRPLLHLTVRLCIPLLLVWWTVDILFLEDLSSFSVIGSPVASLLTLAAAMLAIVTRARDTEVPVLRQDWLWILIGLASFFATSATVTIVSGAAIASGEYALAVRASILKASIDIIAFVMMTGGFLWAPRQTSSGDSSSPERSPSSSSWSRSWRRS